VPRFTKSVFIQAPVERVFAFHERADALDLLSPAFPRVRVLSRTGGLQPGARVDLRIGPFRWVAVHTAYERNRLFVDEQVEGPFARWIHRHEFEEAAGGTRLTDRVDYRLRGGVLFERLFGWAVTFALGRMFAQRHAGTRRHCHEP
jgi:ligand-binding SRPBCC domain-containing protein